MTAKGSGMPSPPLDYPRIKLLTAGNSGVGKSCFVKRFCEDRFVSKYIPTIGIDYGVKHADIQAGILSKYLTEEEAAKKPSGALPTGVRINFWDVSGGPESTEIRNEFYGPAQGIILMYDTRDEDSFYGLDAWWDEISKYIPLTAGATPSIGVAGSTTANTPAGRAVGSNGNTPPIVIVCANKVDREGPGTTTRTVTTELGQKWATAHQCAGYFETSCVTDGAVHEPMKALIHQVVARFLL